MRNGGRLGCNDEVAHIAFWSSTCGVSLAFEFAQKLCRIVELGDYSNLMRELRQAWPLSLILLYVSWRFSAFAKCKTSRILRLCGVRKKLLKMCFDINLINMLSVWSHCRGVGLFWHEYVSCNMKQKLSESANSAKAEMSTESDPRFESGLILIRIQMSAGSLPKCEFIALHGVSHFAKFRKSQRVTVRNDKKSKISQWWRK